MPLCPACHTEQARRVRGACPSCGARVEAYNGRWYRAEIGSPTLAILRHFEARVSQTLSQGKPAPVVFAIPRKGLRFRRELVAAERLLEYAEGDYDLAIAAVDLLFDERKFNWKTRDSLLWLEREFLLALAIARANRLAQAQAERAVEQALFDILAREDVFSS